MSISFRSRFVRFLIGIIPLCVLLASCGDRRQPEVAPLSPEERYLVDAYIKVRRARSYYPTQPALGDSILTYLHGEIDSARVARTIDAINHTPERWSPIFAQIEERLRSPAADTTSR